MHLEPLFTKAIETRLCSGGVVGIVSKSGTQEIYPFGSYHVDNADTPFVADSIFDVASVTKTMPTSTLALMALQEKKVTLNTPIASLVGMTGKHSEQVTFKHLLTQTLAYTIPLSSLRFLPAKELLDEILTFNFEVPPGSSFNYCNATSIVLGLVVEKLYGKSFDVLAQEKIFHPLGMCDTGFRPVDGVHHRIVPTEVDSWRGRVIRGEVHDESAWVLQQEGTPGSAGVFSTVPDILTFLAMMLNDGKCNDTIILDKGILTQVSENQLEELGLFGGLGWELNQRRYTGQFASDRTIGKTGFTGSVIMLDVEKEVALTILTNFTYPRRKSDPTRINKLRSAIADEVFRNYN